MKTKLVSLQENETWSLVKSSTNQKMLTGKWVFKIKKDHFSNMLKYKTWWVIHDYKQMKDLDYTETFVIIIKSQTWKTLFTVTRKNEWQCNQSDIIIIFLYDFLDKEIYIQQSLDLEQESELICLLKKTLYNLKQSLCVWFNTLHEFLKNLDFMQSNYNHSMFITINKFMIIVIYINDILIFRDNNKNMKKI